MAADRLQRQMVKKPKISGAHDHNIFRNRAGEDPAATTRSKQVKHTINDPQNSALEPQEGPQGHANIDLSHRT